MVDPSHLMLLFLGDNIYYTPDKFIPISACSLSSDFSLPLKWQQTYVYAQITSYEKDSGRLVCKIVYSSVQKPEYFSSPDRISFQQGFDLTYIEFLGVTPELRIRGYFDRQADYTAQVSPEPSTAQGRKDVAAAFQGKQLTLPIKGLPLINRIYDVRIEKLKFSSGWIRFDLYLPEIGANVRINIKNERSIEELNQLKPLLLDHLGSSMVQVEIKNAQVKEYKGYFSLYGRCPDLEKIDSSLLRMVAFCYALDAYKDSTFAAHRASDLLLSAKQILSKMPGGEFSQMSGEEEKNFLDSLYEGERHEQHLQYLSSAHQASIMVVRVMKNYKKENSFLFLIKGDLGYFFAWETSRTANATYLWKVEGTEDLSPKEAKPLIKSAYDGLVEDLLFMRNENREEYLKIAPPNFFRVHHADYEDAQGFDSWKQKLHFYLDQQDGL